MIQCLECQNVSATFRVYLYDDEDDVAMFNVKDEDIPIGWDIEDEAELDDNLVCGFCPEHSSRDHLVPARK